jgi:hypothetical protein
MAIVSLMAFAITIVETRSSLGMKVVAFVIWLFYCIYAWCWRKKVGLAASMLTQACSILFYFSGTIIMSCLMAIVLSALEILIILTVKRRVMQKGMMNKVHR